MPYFHLARIAFSALLFLMAFSAPAQDQDREQLRGLLEKTRDAINSGQFADLNPLFHNTFSATMINQDLATSRDELQAFFKKWFKGDGAIVKKLTMNPVADAPTKIYDDRFGVARGSNTEVYELTNGKTYTFKTRWTATMIKDQGTWKILAIHNGTNFLDNPLLEAAEGSVYYFGGGGLVIGLILGVLIGRRRA